MIRDAWKELPRHRYDKVWDHFDQAFQFRPSVYAKDWPTFCEPAPSVTWDIAALLNAFNTWKDPLATPYNLALLAALRSCVAKDEPVLALDWQHTCYLFYPHHFRGGDDPASWCIPALPSGEYHLFVTEDHRLGSLGHPWAATLCVFGEGFVQAYLQATPLGHDRIVRRQALDNEARHRRGQDGGWVHRNLKRRRPGR